MDKPPQLPETNQTEKLPSKTKFKVLLDLFGSEKARENFISLCKEYNIERTRQVILQDTVENYRPTKSIDYSPPKRAELHNNIMEIIAKLAVQLKKVTPLQKSVLRDFHSRENVAEAIKAFILAEQGATGAEEELSKGESKNMSDVAHFHSLGKEH